MKIEILHDVIKYIGRYNITIERHFLDKNGIEQVWEMSEKKTPGRIVAIVALTTENEIIIEKHFRIPMRGYVLEFPAGLMDKIGESEIEVARRELLEETGYVAENVELLVEGPFNMGLSNAEMAIYLGTGATKIAEPELEATEDIEVIKIPLKNFFYFLKTTKEIKDLKLSAVIPYLLVRGLFV